MVFSTRFVIDQTDPVTLAFFRFGIGSACLLPLFLRKSRVYINRADRSAVICLGILLYAVMPSLVTTGLQFTYAARGGLVLASQPLLTLLLARWRGEEQFTFTKVLGITFSVIGLGLALSEGTESTGKEQLVWVGDLLLLAAAVCVSVYNVYSRPYLQQYSALLFTTLTMTVGALALAPFAIGVSLMRGLPVLTPLGWAAVFYIGTFGAGVGYFLWVWALERTTPSRVSIFLSLNPLTAMLLGAAFLNEPITPGFVIGLLAVLIGIVMVARPNFADRQS